MKPTKKPVKAPIHQTLKRNIPIIIPIKPDINDKITHALIFWIVPLLNFFNYSSSLLIKLAKLKSYLTFRYKK